jgi:hypothetical protein
MKAAFVVVVLALLAGGAWAYTSLDHRTFDAVYKRDRLAADNALVITYQPYGAYEGFRFTVLKDGRWVWERTFPANAAEGQPEDALLSPGSQVLLQLGPGCHAELAGVAPPFIPGVTVAKRLKDLELRHILPGDVYEYEAEPGAAAAPPVSGPGNLVTVREDLSQIAQGMYRVTTSGMTAAMTYGLYTITKASKAEERAARTRLEAAHASAVARLDVRVKVLGEIVESVTGPYPILVAGDCPDRAAQLYQGALGGQRLGPRSRPADLQFVPGKPGYVPGARIMPGTLQTTTSYETILRAAADLPRDEVAVRKGQLLVVDGRNGIPLAVQVESCRGTDFFPC